MVSFGGISPLDIKLLKYIKDSSNCTYEDLQKRFKMNYDEIDLRLQLLNSTKNFEEDVLEQIFTADGYVVGKDGMIPSKCFSGYGISQYGNKIPKDYHAYRRQQICDMVLTKIWIPILVSLVSNLLIYVMQRLL